MHWLAYAFLSALAAGATAVRAKIGVQDISSNLATAIRTVVILIFAWSIVLARDESRGLQDLSERGMVLLALSGIATGVSWHPYFKVLQLAPASRVAPIDKLSLPITVLLKLLTLDEPISLRLALGFALMVTGAMLTIAS